MEKQQAIQTIQALYPIDSEWVQNREVGFSFLVQAIQNTGFNWRELPTVLLVEYARLCERLEREQDLASRKHF